MDRTVIGVSVVAMAGLLATASLLMPRINSTRADLRLTANIDVMENLPPEIAFTQAALGSFRGLAVDVLWARAEQMKQDGQHHEAMRLAGWITKLQPRFAQVWQFHAWNMAYNISVTTQTPQERWMWVNAGISLLRDEGIPLNPESVLLYRELSHHFLHKVAGLTDEMHWYYKRELASEWHHLLGPPPQGTAGEVVEWFEPIADAYERYVNRKELTRPIIAEVERVIEDHPRERRLVEPLDEIRHLRLRPFHDRLERLAARLERSDPELVGHIADLRRMTARTVADARRTPTERLIRDEPGIADLLRTLGQWGLRPDRQFLEEVVRAEAAGRSEDLAILGIEPAVQQARMNELLQPWLEDESIAEQRDLLLAFTRARVLYEDYNMDPLWMLFLMEGDWFISDADRALLEDEDLGWRAPIDWRHPGAHGLYWASLGVRRSRIFHEEDDWDVINTDRLVVHGLQQLMHGGKIVYDPITNYYNQMVDPRFIDPYHHAVFGATQRLTAERVRTSAAPDTLLGGHENFLIRSIRTLYFYGDRGDAERYYSRLREEYGELPGRAERFSQPLNEFVINEFMDADGITSPDDAMAIVSGMIFQAINQELAHGEREAGNRMLAEARTIYEAYQQRHRGQFRHAQSEVGRMEVRRFDELLTDTFRRYLTLPPSSPADPLLKSRAWRAAPNALRLAVFDDVREHLYERMREAGMDPEVAFPPPSGLADYRRLTGAASADESEEERSSRPIRR